ncbi:universal stress protein [Aureibaculum sp. A20]|uniref:Universal stress protein n=1 Tax=Aureibaculum flavum TaxID=2795986 RepID=A0ABS0WSN0_9FLAO|nr:universal stress protein [Aureibaculum flavum]MBJ2174991.1 universal stress protein [Aureibaculum flavum]
MKKQILCYTNFSENALNAINYAIKLYEQKSCVFYILNAFQADREASDIEALVPDPKNENYITAKKTSEVGLKNIIAILNSNDKHTYKTLSSFNALLFALKDIIQSNSIDLLVIGTNKASDIENEDGIPTLSIMEYITECSVIAVPGDYNFSRLKNIVLPLDYKEAINEINFTELLAIDKLYHPEIHLAHIKNEFNLSDHQLENKTLLESIFKGTKYSFDTLKLMNINKSIHLLIDNKQYDLIIFLDEKSNYIGNELPRSLRKQIDTHLSIPVLLLNIKVAS